MAFRFLSGLAGSVHTTIGSGTVVDTVPLSTRGRVMAAVQPAEPNSLQAGRVVLATAMNCH